MSKEFKKDDEKNFDHEKFADLLWQNRLGITTDDENCYLWRLIRTNDEAKKWVEAMNEHDPDQPLNIRCKRRILRNWAIVMGCLLIFAGLVYATRHIRSNTKVAEQSEHGFYKIFIKDLIELAKKQYNRDIILDEKDIGGIQCSGGLNSETSLKDFLDDLTFTNHLEYYTDSSTVIHIKKKQ